MDKLGHISTDMQGINCTLYIRTYMFYVVHTFDSEPRVQGPDNQDFEVREVKLLRENVRKGRVT